MNARHIGAPTLLILAMLVSGCGQTHLTQSVPAAVTRTHGRWTATLSWRKAPLELKPFKATLRVKPAAGLTPSSANLIMTEMDMPPVRLQWHTIKPGEYQFVGIATMAGPWNMNVTFLQDHKPWHATFPVTIDN
ncbi:MAG: hypothetical protein C7B45_07830 [Sulfobacillus acidophilus]|uniref:YtkA-like domain-containing protein n=1 Tax=Sulfobacillus acidophilus TaxID=53633 RepID=A0A2T2WIR3_9FIRM|nr:MAG: hypothetical protein C7B45_07830 [Sulfobacillus acidophilus]